MTDSAPDAVSRTAPPALTALRGLCALALTLSAMLLVDYTAAQPTFCAEGGGCAAVRASGYGYLGSVPVPAVGLLAFSALLCCTLFPLPWARRALQLGAALGALGGLAFLSLQLFVIGELCPFCAVVDVVGVSLLPVALWLRRAEGDSGPAPEAKPAWRWLLVAAVVVAAPLLYPKLRPQTPLPSALAPYVDGGKLTVIEFADFECPFCRRLHPVLHELVEARGDSIHFVRLNHPLPFHRFAEGAARAYLCADAEGHGDAMASRLFEAESLEAEHLLVLAQEEGLDLPAFGACLTADETSARLERESALFETVGLRGLPSTFIGDELIVGAQPREVIEAALERAAAGRRRFSLGAVPLAAIAGALVLLLVWWPSGLGRRRS